MRWQRLFDDLEARLDGERGEDLDAEVADRIRGELAATSLADRLRGAAGHLIAVEAAGVGRLDGTLRRVGSGWFVLEDAHGSPTVVLLTALVGVHDLPLASLSTASAGLATAQAGLGQVLRVLARDRTALSVVTVDGARISGTIDRVGADYFDLAEHPIDEPRRARAVRLTRTVASARVAVLRPSR